MRRRKKPRIFVGAAVPVCESLSHCECREFIFHMLSGRQLFATFTVNYKHVNKHVKKRINNASLSEEKDKRKQQTRSCRNTRERNWLWLFHTFQLSANRSEAYIPISAYSFTVVMHQHACFVGENLILVFCRPIMVLPRSRVLCQAKSLLKSAKQIILFQHIL